MFFIFIWCFLKKDLALSLWSSIIDDLYSGERDEAFSVIGHSCKMKIGILSIGLILSIEFLDDKEYIILDLSPSFFTKLTRSLVFVIILFSFYILSVEMELLTDVIIESNRSSSILL